MRTHVATWATPYYDIRGPSLLKIFDRPPHSGCNCKCFGFPLWPTADPGYITLTDSCSGEMYWREHTATRGLDLIVALKGEP